MDRRIKALQQDEAQKRGGAGGANALAAKAPSAGISVTASAICA
jgi:hypothetical protein